MPVSEPNSCLSAPTCKFTPVTCSLSSVKFQNWKSVNDVVLPFISPFQTSSSISLFFNKKFIYFIYLFLAALGLRCCARAFSSCSERASLWWLLLLSVGSRCVGVCSCGT